MRILTIGLVLAAAGSASAQVWNEVGDAGQDGIGAAQVTVGSGSLDSITGSLAGVGDVDLYQIQISDVSGFSASTQGGASFDTMLFLFAADGTGITWNDDADGLQSLINEQGLLGSGSSEGIYYLAVASFVNEPLDGAGDFMFGFSSWPGARTDQRMPETSGSLASWTDSGFDEGDYSIRLTGAEYAVIPAPASLALLGLGGLAAARRRR